MTKEVVVTSSGPVVLSEQAAAFMNSPAPMPVVEDIYSISDRRAWVVVCTEFAAERKAEEKLQEAKVSTYLPIERAYVRNEVVRTTMVAGMVQRRRTKTVRRPVDRPLLPGYLFAEVPLRDGRVPPEAGARVKAAGGVFRVLGNERGPLPIPAEIVEFFRKQQCRGTFDRTTSKQDWVKKGNPVRIADGPFAFFNATIEAVLPNEMLKVLVSIFGRASPVTLELAQVEKT